MQLLVVICLYIQRQENRFHLQKSLKSSKYMNAFPASYTLPTGVAVTLRSGFNE